MKLAERLEPRKKLLIYRVAGFILGRCLSMAKGDVDVFSIEWEGLDEFHDMLDKMDKESEKIIMEEMTKFGMLAEEGTKALAPHDEGTLDGSSNFDISGSVSFDKAKKEGGDIV